jgi:hypothetical protein
VDTQLDLGHGLLSGVTEDYSPMAHDSVFRNIFLNSTANTQNLSLLHRNNFEALYARIQVIYGRATVRPFFITPNLQYLVRGLK